VEMRAALVVVLLLGLTAFAAAESRLLKMRTKAAASLTAETDAEDESALESDTEVEGWAEADAHVDMSSSSFTEQDLAALAKLAEAESVDGSWHVYSDVATEKAHEGITAYAFAQAGGAAIFDADKIRVGTIWNDMPSGADGNQAELDAMLKDGHMDIDTWTRDFFNGKPNELVFNVHYGCLQHFHSMAPIPRAEAKAKASTRTVFTNKDVKGFILGQVRQWWDLAVAAVKSGKPNAKQWYSFYMGHIMHLVQDSYPRGHAVRAATASSCGAIVLFQGYDAQHGNGAHKAGDFTPPKRKETDPSLPKRYECAKQFSAQVLKVFANCVRARGNGASCTYAPIRKLLHSNVYNFAPGAEARKAGGSRKDFAKTDIAADFAEEPNVDIGTGKVSLFNPKSTKLWKNLRGTKLCDAPVVSKVKLGAFFYTEKPFRQFIDYVAPNSEY